ncbi:MAG TPA: porin family protein [Pyrinomonadaceae bacterium]|nr:porin family protein [Pyrinomonadaceae bacterium]
MRTHRHHPYLRRALRLCFGPALLVVLCLATAPKARASSNCSMGFPLSGTPVVVDGQLGADWVGASQITSLDPCFGQLDDFDNVPKDVTIHTKRYTSAGKNFIAFFFEVTDFSDAPQPGQDCGGQLCSGERIILQFDPNRSRGASINGDATSANPFLNAINNEYQIVITHKWLTGGGGPNDIAFDVKVFTRDPGGACNPSRWLEIPGGFPVGQEPAISIQKAAGPQRYLAEIAIPLSLLGNPTSDIGLAVAVLNDFGTNAAGPPFGAGVGIPNTLQFTSNENPVSGCRGNWVVPDDWGTGFFGNAPGDVTISRMPAYWNSNQIEVHQCDSAGATYEWHANQPCKAVIRAFLNNTTGAAQSRNLLYLWAKHGTGDPDEYTFVALKKFNGIAVNPNAGPFDSPVWSNMPAGDPSHPCVRVYVLPPNLLQDFDENFFNTHPTLTKAQVAAMLAAYGAAFGTGDQNWAQKNINAPSPNSSCPVQGCAASLRDLLKPERDAVLASLPQERHAVVADAAQSSRRSLFDGGEILPVAFAPSDSAGASQTATDVQPPVVKNPGKHVLMSGTELERFQRGYVIVQVRTFGYANAAGDKPLYTFVQNMGGVIELIPVEMLKKDGTVPFQLTVFNTDEARTIYQVVDVLSPSGMSSVEVGLNTERTTFAAGESRLVHGFVKLPGSINPPAGTFKRWGLSLHAGVSIPHGDFDTIFDPGPNFAVDLEYRITRLFSLEGIYGFHRFGGGTFGSVTASSLNVHQFSLDGKIYGSSAPVRPFFDFGGGAYEFGTSGVTRGGINIGGGVQYDVTPTFAVEGVYNFHNIFTNGSNTRFSALQGGVRFRF